MDRRTLISSSDGYSLIEVLVVLTMLVVCSIAASVSLVEGLQTQEARGAAQTWQAAAAWAQLGVLWQGGSVRVGYEPGSLLLPHNYQLCCGELGPSTAPAPATTNVARWRTGEGVSVQFSGALGSPDGGGSLFFKTLNQAYRVVVRPESGLTSRSLVGTQQ